MQTGRARSEKAHLPSDEVNEMSEVQVRTIIEKEAKALGLSLEDAISRVKSGDVGDNYLWRDLASLVRLLDQ
jgi:hypothetical protein